jgi:TetR/AcrR family transcriptional regulator
MATNAAVGSTREQILAAAENLFATQGYQATTIKQVAEQVGVQGPALYKHFSSKRALFEEVLEQLFTPFVSMMADTDDLAATLQNIVRQQLANPNASRIVQLATLSGGEDLALLVERWYRPFFENARELAARGQPGITAVSVMAFHSMLLGYLTLAPLHQAIFDSDPLAEEALNELLELEASFASLLTPASG